MNIYLLKIGKACVFEGLAVYQFLQCCYTQNYFFRYLSSQRKNVRCHNTPF